VYYYWDRPKNGILNVTVMGLPAKFHVRNPDELRLAESVSGQWGELPVIEGFLSHIHTGDVVFDVGANIGIYTILLAKKVGATGKVIAFEPEKESYDRLVDNAGINDLKNIIVQKKALGQEDKQAKLYIGKTTGNFSLIKSYEKGVGSQDIEIVSGDAFLKAQNLPVPKAVKIDVEGYEYNVLVGLQETLRQPSCKVICCEVHPGLFPDGVTEETVLKYIESLGFTETKMFKRAFSAYHIIACKP